MPASRRLFVAALLSAVPHGSWAAKAHIGVEVYEQDVLGSDEDYDVEDSRVEGSKGSESVALSRAKEFFDSWDENADGLIEMKEAREISDIPQDQVEQYFAQADADKDDMVSLSELQQLLEGLTDEEDEGSSAEDEESSAEEDSLVEVPFKERVSSLLRHFDPDKPAEDLIADFDENQDQALDMDEARNIPSLGQDQMMAYFKQADKDKSGKVSVGELNELLKGMEDDDESPDEDDTDSPDDSVEEEDEAKEFFERWDANKDGFIDMEEVGIVSDVPQDQVEKFFAQADADQDQKVNLTELQQEIASTDEENEDEDDDEKDSSDDSEDESLEEGGAGQ